MNWQASDGSWWASQARNYLYNQHFSQIGRRFCRLSILFFLAVLFYTPTVHADVFYTYDDLGRIKTVRDSNGDIAEYVYDATGNILQVRRVGSGSLAITGFSPSSGPVGTTVSIHGSGFSTTAGNNTVRFNGVAASVTSASPTSIAATVPASATSGPISVTVGTNTATSVGNFTVTAAAGRSPPTITDFTPKIGGPGTVVTVTGTNFDPPPGSTRVELNATVAASTVSSPSSLTMTVPANTSSGRIFVATVAGVAMSAADFIVPPGSIFAGTIAQTTRTTVGSTASVAVDTANQHALVLFDASQGSYISLDITAFTVSPSSASVSYSVYTPNNGLLTSGTVTATSRSIHLPAIPKTGTYTIAFSPQNATTTLTVSPRADTWLSPNQMATLETTFSGQSLRLPFAGTSGESLGLEIAGFATMPAGQLVTLSVLKPNGAVLATTTASAVGSFLQLPVLPESGTYAVIVDPADSALASLRLTLDSGTSLSLNGPAVSVPIATAGEAARYVFNAAPTLPIQANVTLTLNGAGATVTIYQPNGSSLGSTTCSGQGACSLGVTSLPSAGPFSVVVQPTNGATGNIAASVSVTGPFAALLPGNPSTLAVSPGTNAIFTFTANAGESPAINLVASPAPSSTSSYNLSLFIYKPDGTSHATETTVNGTMGSSTPNCGITSSNTACRIQFINLPVSGTYTVVVRPSIGAPSNLTLTATLYTQAQAALAAGATSSISLTVPQNGVFTFFANQGESPLLQVVVAPAPSSGSYSLRVFVYKPDGMQLTTNVTYNGSTTASCSITSSNTQCNIQFSNIPVGGTYTVVIRPEVDAPNSVSLTATLTGTAGIAAVLIPILELLLSD